MGVSVVPARRFAARATASPLIAGACVVVVAEKPLEGELSPVVPDGSVVAKSRERHGRTAHFRLAEVSCASPARRAEMSEYRAWFHERRPTLHSAYWGAIA
jgi:hypothetical protein